MVEAARGSLEWPCENEVRWVALNFVQAPTHRVMIHTKVGFLFDNHGLIDSEAVAVEAKMLTENYCGCHLLALWWQSDLEWKRCFYKVADAPELRKLVVELTNEQRSEQVAFSVDGDPLSVQLFMRVVKAVDPKAKVGF